MKTLQVRQDDVSQLCSARAPCPRLSLSHRLSFRWTRNPGGVRTEPRLLPGQLPGPWGADTCGMDRHEGSDHLLWLSSRWAHKPNTESLAEHWVGTSEARGKELGEGDPVLEGQAGHSPSKRALLELLQVRGPGAIPGDASRASWRDGAECVPLKEPLRSRTLSGPGEPCARPYRPCGPAMGVAALMALSSQATESIKMLVTLCQCDTEEIRNVASETLLSLGEFRLHGCFLLVLSKGAGPRRFVGTGGAPSPPPPRGAAHTWDVTHMGHHTRTGDVTRVLTWHTSLTLTQGRSHSHKVHRTLAQGMLHTHKVGHNHTHTHTL